MEVAGLAIGALGLAGLVSICTDCFELVQRGRYLGRDFDLLETQFANQRIRLLAWGRTFRLDETEDDEVVRCLKSTLLHLVNLLRDGDALQRKYGLRTEEQSVIPPSASSSSWAITRHTVRSTLSQSLAQLSRKVSLTQKEATLGTKVKWAIEDKERFGALVQNVRMLVDDLESLIRCIGPGIGLQECQRQMVHRVVDSICDLPMLESTEEARMGRLDPIADAASLKLCYIRDQFESIGDGTSSSRDASPSLLQGETYFPVVEEDWEIIAKMPTISSTGETRLHLDLHRVHCDFSTTAIYLEEPSYDTRRNIDTQWVLIDEQHPSKEPRFLHLCGKRPVVDLESLLVHNAQLDFIVFHDYQCTHSAVGDEPLDRQPTNQSVRVVSSKLFSALQELPAIGHEHPVLQLNAEASFPYYWFYDVRDSLDSQIQAHCESVFLGLGNFQDFLRQTTALEYAKVDDQLSRGVISWKYIRYLFRAGSVVVERHPKGIGQYQAYRIEEEPHDPSVSLGLRLSVYRMEKRRSDLKVRTTLTLQREPSISLEDEMQLSSLDVIPLQYADEIDEDFLVSRGEQLLSCFPNRLVSYDGPVVDCADDTPGGRWMVDPPSHEELHGIGLGDHTYERIRLSPTDWERDTLLLQPTVHGFNLETHMWHELLVLYTHEVTWDKKQFGRLILDRADREYLQDCVTSSALKASDGAPFSLGLLFHGDPGAGKTFAAQAVGELIERPLYHITPRDVGSNAKNLAKTISTAIRLATAWNCVIFLKDVGHLLNMESSLAELMRLFDTFRGIIILTFSDRGTPLTETLSSKIPLSVHLPLLSEQQSRMLWGNGLRQLQRMGFNVDSKLLHGSLTKFSERGLSCRDIQNALSNLERLATFSPQEINKKMVERVMNYKLS